MKDAAKVGGVPVQFNRCGSMFCGYFTEKPSRFIIWPTR
jgi:glutamate-1-semialdehyde aminotransferase